MHICMLLEGELANLSIRYATKIDFQGKNDLVENN